MFIFFPLLHILPNLPHFCPPNLMLLLSLKKKKKSQENKTELKREKKIHQALTKNTQNTVEPVLCWPTTGCAHSLRHSVVEMPSVAPLTRTDEFPSPSKVRRIIEGEVGTKS